MDSFRHSCLYFTILYFPAFNVCASLSSPALSLSLPLSHPLHNLNLFFVKFSLIINTTFFQTISSLFDIETKIVIGVNGNPSIKKQL